MGQGNVLKSLSKSAAVPRVPRVPANSRWSYTRETHGVDGFDVGIDLARVELHIEKTGTGGTLGQNSESATNQAGSAVPGVSAVSGTAGTAQDLTGFPGFDVLGLPFELLPGCPIPTTLVVDVPGIKARVLLTTSRTAYSAAVAPACVAFSPKEMLALGSAYERAREAHEGLRDACVEKLRKPGWTLDLAWACGGAVTEVDPARAHATVGRVLEAYGARLVAVELEGRSWADDLDATQEAA
jgi:hypothetical protein